MKDLTNFICLTATSKIGPIFNVQIVRNRVGSWALIVGSLYTIRSLKESVKFPWMNFILHYGGNNSRARKCQSR